MYSNKNFEITIKSIKHSENKVQSLDYLLDLNFKINDRHFTHTDYIDSSTRKSLKALSNENQILVAKRRVDLMIEIEVRLRITDTQAQEVFYQVLEQADIFIDKLKNKEQLLPLKSNLILDAVRQGFWLINQTSAMIHLMKQDWRHDREDHICTNSIDFLIQELADYAAGEGVFESYSYRQISRQLIDQYGVTISVNQFGNGWLIQDWHNQNDEHPIMHVQTLRELSDCIGYLGAKRDSI